MRSFFLTLFSLVCFVGIAQVDTFQQDIINYLNLNGTGQQYGDAYDSMFEVLKETFEPANVPEKVWGELKNDRSESLNEVISFLSFAYRKHFTQEEIATMTNFYKTEAAQKMLNPVTGPLSETENVQIALYFESDVAKKVEAKLPELSVDISEISQHWSKDLFQEKMLALLEKGYRPKQ